MSELSQDQLAKQFKYNEYLINGLYLIPIAPDRQTGKLTKEGIAI
jgi:hypothetical protein